MEINNVRIFSWSHSSIGTTQKGYDDVSGMDFKQIPERFILEVKYGWFKENSYKWGISIGKAEIL